MRKSIRFLTAAILVALMISLFSGCSTKTAFREDGCYKDVKKTSSTKIVNKDVKVIDSIININ